jgi:predicted nucleic acid-binding protein
MSGVAATSPMTAEAFFDTNIVVYAFIETDVRSAIAASVLADGGVVNVQVLNEFVNVARRKHTVPWSDIRESLTVLRTRCGEPRPLTTAIHESGLAIAERYHYRIYDAMIIAAAVDAGCRTLYSEDLANGQTIQGVRITNPFA